MPSCHAQLDPPPSLTDRACGSRVPAAGTAAEGRASVPSRALGRAGPAVRAAGRAQDAGWQGAPGPGRSPAESSQASGAASAAPPSVAAVKTAVPVAGAQRGGWREAACRGAAVAACAGWRRSAPGAPWMGRTAAGSASGPRAEWHAGRAASLL